MSDAKIVFGKENGFEFRIPSIVNADGVLVAACDNGRSGADWGYIELCVRRSFDGGESWSEIQTIAKPPARSTSADIENTKSAFFIDPCMAVAPNGDIVMLVTFFPESKGIHNMKYLEKKKIAFTRFDGAKCPILYDRNDNYFIILENGAVIDKVKAKTAYTIKGVGELYKGDEYVGNIYLNGAQGKAEGDTETTFGAPLKSPKRSYIFLLVSKDKGETWSEPRDITPSILNENDGAFIGVSPGSGLTTESGRILIPLYTEEGTVCIYSDDNGETWQRNQQIPYTGNKDEWTMIEAPNGRIYGFGRDKGKIPATISFDRGITWAKGDKPPIKAPKCQKNALVVDERVFLSHPNSTERANGVISLGRFARDKKGEFKGLRWSGKDIEINKTFFAYSCMVKIDSTHIGILYENKPSGEIAFKIIEI